MLNQQLILGSVYRVKFKGVFERHGVCTTAGLTCLHKGNGVFRLEAITTFRTLVLSGVKLYDTFFAPLGITSEEYDQYYSDKPADKYSPVYAVKEVKETDTQTEYGRTKDTGELVHIKKTVTITTEKYVETGESVLAKFAQDSVNYAAYPIYKLVDVVDPDDVVYAPALTIDGFPEIEIAEYQDLSLVFRLGYFDDPAKLDPLLLAIRERMAAYGIKPRQIKLYSTGSKYLNPDEYEKLRITRLPATIVQIPNDRTEAIAYVNKKIIDVNRIRTIVDGETTDDTQVALSSLQTRPAILDRSLYTQEVDANAVYNGSGRYYELLKNEVFTKNSDDPAIAYRRLTDCPVGSRILRLVKKTFSEGDITAGLPAYRSVVDTYVQIAFNEPRSLSLYMRETTKTDREEVEVETVTEYRHPTPKELDDGNLVLYRKLSNQYEKVESPVSGEEYYTPVSQTGSIGTGRIFCENYASEDVLDLVGRTFKYETASSQNKSVASLTTADIISFAQGSEVEGIEMFIRDENISNRDRADKYSGRFFSTNFEVEIAEGVTQTVPVEIRIPNDPDEKLSGLTGNIVGQPGIVSKDTYILNSDELGRNYYIKYLEAQAEKERLLARNAALENVIKQLTGRS